MMMMRDLLLLCESYCGQSKATATTAAVLATFDGDWWLLMMLSLLLLISLQDADARVERAGGCSLVRV